MDRVGRSSDRTATLATSVSSAVEGIAGALRRSRSSRGRGASNALLASVGAVLATCAVAAPAEATKYVDRVIGSTSSGTQGGQFSTPRGVAVNDGTTDGNGTDGWFYVADDNNHRIQAFDAAGVFQFAIGRDVIKASPAIDVDLGNVFEKCTTATDCKAGSFGTTTDGPAGEFDNPQGVAVNQATGHLYVRDRDNRRVQEFTATGEFVRMWGWDVISGAAANANGTTFEVCDVTNGNTPADCKQGTSGAGLGQFGASSTASTGIAVQQSTGDVFVADPGSTANRRVQKFESDGSSPQAIGSSAVFTGSNVPTHVAIDDTGILYANDELTAAPGRHIERYDVGAASFLSPLSKADGSIPSGIPEDSTTSLVVDASSRNLLFTRGQGTALPLGVFELANADGFPGFADRHLPDAAIASGLSLNATSGDMQMASALTGHRVFIADDDGASPAAVDLLPATAVGATDATLHAEVSSSDSLTTGYRIEVSRNGGEWLTVGSGQVSGDAASEPVQATASGLRPNTLYRFRVVTNREFANPDVVSAELTFLTDAVAPELADVRATAIGDTSAVLQGRVNPHSTETRYRFEYGVGTFNRSVPVPEASVGAGPQFVFVSQRLTALQPGTTYRFRLVASSATEGTTTGATQTFTTRALPAGSSERAYELVSPADKVSGIGVGSWGGGRRGAISTSGYAALEGERFAPMGAIGSVLVDSAQAYASDPVFSERTATGWVSHSPVTHAASGNQTFRFILMASASDDLSTSIWSSNEDLLRIFPELEAWPNQIDAEVIADWDGRWELFAPMALDQLLPRDVGNRRVQTSFGVVSADGSHVVGTANLAATSPARAVVGGMAGPTDPGHPSRGDLVAGRAVYLDDVSAGLSGRFVGNGVHSNVGVCAGGTVLPRVASGKLEQRDCPPALPGPVGMQRLISERGATLQAADLPQVKQNSEQRVISRDGSRVFFLSPDPLAAGVPSGIGSSCSGTDASTLCPPQLYVRQRNADGTVVTRWLSRAEPGLFGSQDVSLVGTSRFEGASADGDRVFFRTNAPLTVDDPNGAGGPAPAGGVKTGSASNSSWDLYMYELADGNDPTGPGARLTRVSAGADGNGDCNVTAGSERAGALRFASEDGRQAYFTCAAALAGAGGGPGGGMTVAAGTSATTDFANLYAYGDRDGTGAWEFVARLPRSDSPSGGVASCATTGMMSGGLLVDAEQTTSHGFRNVPVNCVRGTSDGMFVTFWTAAALTADDPDGGSVDGYAYDAAAGELTRITASQGGVGGSYPCGSSGAALTTPCHGDDGFGGETLPLLGVATDPLVAGDRIAFFHSRSRLVREDTDEAYDVYQWRNGELSLISTGRSVGGAGHNDTGGAFYKGNDRTGRNVYFATNDDLSWQDVDAVLDIYTARVGGGIAQPPQPTICMVLAGGCHSGADAPVAQPRVGSTGPVAVGNADPGVRANLRVARPGAKTRRRAARSGVLALRVRSSTAGRVAVVVKARIGKRVRRIGRASKLVPAGRAQTVRIKLNRGARRKLGRGRRLALRITVSSPETRDRAITVRVRRAGR